MAALIKMYRPCQASSRTEAARDGALRGVFTASAAWTFDDPEVAATVAAIVTACDMMDGGFNLSLTLYTDTGIRIAGQEIEYRDGKRIDIDPEVRRFFDAFDTAFGVGLTLHEVAHAVKHFDDPKGSSDLAIVRDAWVLWTAARKGVAV